MQGQQNTGSFLPDSIPLPNEIPLPPKLADVPSRVLHSATVETLIQHNDDLQSRLKVHLRRGAELESRILELEDRLNEVSHQRDSVFAQIEVLREKDRSSHERSQHAESRLESLRSELEASQTEVRSLHLHIDALRKDLTRYQRYQRRISKWVKPLLEQKNQALKQAFAACRVLEAERETLMTKSQNNREDFEFQKLDFETRIAKLKADQSSLVEHYETQIKKADGQISDLKSRLASAEEKASSLDAYSADKAKATNEKIYFERRAKELESELHSERSRLKQTIDDLAAECASLRAGLESVRSSKELLETERDASERSRLKAESQLQGLRSVFKDLTDRVDRLTTQNEALERINESISQQLNKARQDVKIQLNDQALDRVGFKSEEQVSRSHSIDRSKIEGLLSDLEMKAFGIRPEHLRPQTQAETKQDNPTSSIAPDSPQA